MPKTVSGWLARKALKSSFGGIDRRVGSAVIRASREGFHRAVSASRVLGYFK